MTDTVKISLVPGDDRSPVSQISDDCILSGLATASIKSTADEKIKPNMTPVSISELTEKFFLEAIKYTA